MPALTPEQLAALANTGALNQEIEATLGRKMNDAEKNTVNRARTIWRLRRASNKAAADKQESGSTNWRKVCERLKAALLEMQVSRQQDGLVARADIEEQAKADAALIKTSMLGMANALAPQLVGLKKVTAVRTILNDWARSTLQSWHDAVQGDAAGDLTDA
jgi:hypothetical protein